MKITGGLKGLSNHENLRKPKITLNPYFLIEG